MAALPESALFVCPACATAHEPDEEGLRPFAPLVARATSGAWPAGPGLPPDARPQYLAVWRLTAEVEGGDEQAPSFRAGDGPVRRGCLYVAAFAIARTVVEHLGVRLTRLRPALAPVAAGCAGMNGPAVFSPVVLGRGDARLLGEFVYLALVSEGQAQRPPGEHRLRVLEEELAFIPALPDPRCVHDANWRLLLREFDGAVG